MSFVPGFARCLLWRETDGGQVLEGVPAGLVRDCWQSICCYKGIDDLKIATTARYAPVMWRSHTIAVTRKGSHYTLHFKPSSALWHMVNSLTDT